MCFCYLLSMGIWNQWILWSFKTSGLPCSSEFFSSSQHQLIQAFYSALSLSRAVLKMAGIFVILCMTLSTLPYMVLEEKYLQKLVDIEEIVPKLQTIHVRRLGNIRRDSIYSLNYYWFKSIGGDTGKVL